MGQTLFLEGWGSISYTCRSCGSHVPRRSAEGVTFRVMRLETARVQQKFCKGVDMAGHIRTALRHQGRENGVSHALEVARLRVNRPFLTRDAVCVDRCMSVQAREGPREDACPSSSLVVKRPLIRPGNTAGKDARGDGRGRF